MLWKSERLYSIEGEKVSIAGTDMDFMSCYSMKKNFGHSEDMRNMVYGRFVHLRVVVTCKNR